MIRFRLDPLREWAEGVAQRAADPSPALEASAPEFSEAVKAHFYRGGPEGAPWKPLKDASGRKPLVRTGALRDSIRAEVADRELTVGSALPYAAIHQRGGRAIPARPFLVIPDENLRRAVESLIGWLVSGEARRG